MRPLTSGSVFLATLLLSSASNAQSAPPQLKNYSPPPMFGAAVQSRFVETIETPAAVSSSAPVSVNVERAIPPQSSGVPAPAKTTIKKPAPEMPEKKIEAVPAQPVSRTIAVENKPARAVSAEELLNFPVTTEDETLPALMTAPDGFGDELAVPDVSSKKASAAKPPVTKTGSAAKKTVPVQALSGEPKKAPAQAKTLAVQDKKASATQKDVLDLQKSSAAAGTVPSPKTTEKPLPAYHLDGQKNMLSAAPAKVEKVEMLNAEPQVVNSTPPIGSKIPTGDSTLSPPLLTSPEKTAPPQLVSLEFRENLAELQPDQKKVIDSDILPKINSDTKSHLEILAYATNGKEGKNARSLSLNRGLSMRAYLLEKGIDPSRITIHALGDTTKEKPLNRVDVQIAPPT